MEAKRCSPGVGQKLRPLSRTLSWSLVSFLKDRLTRVFFFSTFNDSKNKDNSFLFSLSNQEITVSTFITPKGRSMSFSVGALGGVLVPLWR